MLLRSFLYNAFKSCCCRKEFLFKKAMEILDSESYCSLLHNTSHAGDTSYCPSKSKWSRVHVTASASASPRHHFFTLIMRWAAEPDLYSRTQR